MAFIVSDILAAIPGPSTDGAARTPRDGTPPTSRDARKGFSSVLQSARGEVGRSPNRAVEDGRSVARPDGDSHENQTTARSRSTHPADSQPSSQTTERVAARDSEETTDGEARTGLATSTQQSEVAPEPQQQGLVPTSVSSAVSTLSEAPEQTKGETQTDSYLIDDETSVGRGSQHPLISKKSSDALQVDSDSIAARSATTHGNAAPNQHSTQPLNQTQPQDNDREKVSESLQRRTGVDAHDALATATDQGDSSVIAKSSGPVVQSSSQTQASAEGSEVPVPTTVLKEKGFGVQDQTLRHESKEPDHLVPNQAHQYGQARDPYGALGTNMEQTFSQGRQPGDNGSEQLSELWSSHNGRPREHGDSKASQPVSVDQLIASGSPTELAVSGASRQTSAVPVTHTPPTAVTQAQASVRAEDFVETTGVAVNRSVVVNVAQPDLGHVNIRVAMANDMVHTHFSSERLEVGQFLINSQDRLQAALQASGLDLGQFRVDIDRQNSGRSFQQGLSQEHGQAWNQGGHGSGQESHADPHDKTRGTLSGLLNVVA